MLFCLESLQFNSWSSEASFFRRLLTLLHTLIIVYLHANSTNKIRSLFMYVHTVCVCPSCPCWSSPSVSCSLAWLLRSVTSQPLFRWWEVNTEKLTAAAKRRAAVVIRLEQHEDWSLPVTVRGEEEREVHKQQRRQTAAAAAPLTQWKSSTHWPSPPLHTNTPSHKVTRDILKQLQTKCDTLMDWNYENFS